MGAEGGGPSAGFDWGRVGECDVWGCLFDKAAAAAATDTVSLCLICTGGVPRPALLPCRSCHQETCALCLLRLHLTRAPVLGINCPFCRLRVTEIGEKQLEMFAEAHKEALRPILLPFIQLLVGPGQRPVGWSPLWLRLPIPRLSLSNRFPHVFDSPDITPFGRPRDPPPTAGTRVASPLINSSASSTTTTTLSVSSSHSPFPAPPNSPISLNPTPPVSLSPISEEAPLSNP